MKDIKYKIVKAMLRPMNPSVSILLGFYNVGWGLWVANPFVTSFTNSSLYSVMTAVSPELFWGLAVVCIGAIVITGAVTMKKRYIMTGTLLSALFWLFVSISLFLGQAANASFIDALVIATYAAFTYLNVKVNNKARPIKVYIP